jgi:hypothetical protein
MLCNFIAIVLVNVSHVRSDVTMHSFTFQLQPYLIQSFLMFRVIIWALIKSNLEIFCS